MGDAWWGWFWVYRWELVGAGAALAAIEALLLLRRGRAWSLKESLSNVFTLFLGYGSRSLTLPLRYGIFAAAHAVSPFRIHTSIGAFVVCYVLLDLIYYWKHRWLHENAFGWSMHSVHHSSVELNLTTAIRSSVIQRNIDDLFYLPLSMMGFDPVMVLVIADLNLISQYWIHTRVIPRLGPLEWFLNTPSAHRMHHAATRSQHDSNYGSTFIVWDRLFGTFKAEPENDEPEYGTDMGFVTHDPFRIQLAGHLAYFRRAAQESDERRQDEHRPRREPRPAENRGGGDVERRPAHDRTEL